MVNCELPTLSGKTLVTGGTGFVGRAVVEELLAAGREVRVLARNPDHPALAGLAVDVAAGRPPGPGFPDTAPSRAAPASSTWPRTTASGCRTRPPCTPSTWKAPGIC